MALFFLKFTFVHITSELKSRCRLISWRLLCTATGERGVEKQPIILIVEDDQLIQSVVEESLTDGGFEIVIASSGKNALELLDASEGKYRALGRGPWQAQTDLAWAPSLGDALVTSRRNVRLAIQSPAKYA
jgi:hypothetical protein